MTSNGSVHDTYKSTDAFFSNGHGIMVVIRTSLAGGSVLLHFLDLKLALNVGAAKGSKIFYGLRS